MFVPSSAKNNRNENSHLFFVWTPGGIVLWVPSMVSCWWWQRNRNLIRKWKVNISATTERHSVIDTIVPENIIDRRLRNPPSQGRERLLFGCPKTTQMSLISSPTTPPEPFLQLPCLAWVTDPGQQTKEGDQTVFKCNNKSTIIDTAN